MPATKRKQKIPNLKKVPHSAVAGYRFRFQMDRHIVPTGEPDEYVLPIMGEILWHPEPDEERFSVVGELRVGELKAFVIQANRACNDGRDLFEACDAHSQEMCNLYEDLYDPKDERLIDSVSDGCSGADALVIVSVMLLPKHRGHRVGQLAVLRAIADCGNGVAAAVLQPFPIGLGTVPPELDKYKLNFHRDQKAAVQRLRQHWGELGFVPVKETEWLALDLSRNHPSFGDLVAG